MEYVVLLDEAGEPAGTADKAGVHHAATPLHLAFSCYLLDGENRLLMTRRALSKKAFAGIWSNSCCGHPAPGEDPADAVRRRVRQELGLELADLTCVLPAFRYRAVDPGGTVENEICPVFTATAVGEPDPDPAEVAEWRWVPWADVLTLAATSPWAISPWAALQVPLLSAAHPSAAGPRPAG